MVMTALGIVVMTALGRRNRIFVGCRNLEQYLVVVILVKSVDDNAIGVIRYILESTTRLLSTGNWRDIIPPGCLALAIGVTSGISPGCLAPAIGVIRYLLESTT